MEECGYKTLKFGMRKIMDIYISGVRYQKERKNLLCQLQIADAN